MSHMQSPKSIVYAPIRSAEDIQDSRTSSQEENDQQGRNRGIDVTSEEGGSE